MKTRKRVILVTGASSGFGMLSAVALAKRGHFVYATMRNLQKKTQLENICKFSGAKVQIRQLDVTDPDAINAVVHEIENSVGLDVLINNAGFAYSGFFEDVSDDDFRDQFSTNFFGLVSCTRAVLAGMRKRNSGLIIQISSIAGLSGMPGLSAYTASKFAVEGFSECLRYEVKPYGINVVLVEPGMFKTAIYSAASQKRGAGADNPQSPYYAAFQRMQKQYMAFEEQLAQNPERVAKLIVRIVEAGRPKLRYLIGADARAEAFLKKLLPGSWFEFFIERVVLKNLFP